MAKLRGAAWLWWSALLFLAGIYPVQAERPAQAWRALLESGQYDALSESLTAWEADYERGALTVREYSRELTKLGELPDSQAGALDAWVQARKADWLALRSRGAYYENKGWRQRGGAWSREVRPEQWAGMRAAFDRAESDLRAAIALKADCDACYADLISMGKTHGRESPGTWHAAVLRARKDAPLSALAYLMTLQPRWGGAQGEAEAFVEGFPRDHPQSRAIPLLRSQLLVWEADRYKEAEQYEEAAQRYSAALEIDPERAYTMYKLGSSLGSLQHWDKALVWLDRSKALDPDETEMLAARAWVLAGLQRLDEGEEDLAQAIRQGNRWALGRAMAWYAVGRYGIKKDPEKSWRFCQQGLEARIPEGYTCTAGHYFSGIHVKRDLDQSFKYFKLGAEAGDEEAMADLAVFYWKGMATPRDEAAAIDWWYQARGKGAERADAQLRSKLSSWRYWREVTLRDWLKGLSEQLATIGGVIRFLLESLFGQR